MSTFIQLLVTGKIDSKKNTKRINEVLTKLQTDGAVIKDVTLAKASVSTMFSMNGNYSIYVITYEAKEPISM